MIEYSLENPHNPDREPPFRFPALSDEQVVAIGKILRLHIDKRIYSWNIDAIVYRLEERQHRKPKKDVIIETGDGTDAVLYRGAFSILEARVAEELDSETLLVRTVNPLQTTDTLVDMVWGRRYCAMVLHKGEKTSERVMLETRRVRDPDKYREDVERRLPNLIAERRERARVLGEELRQAYESVVGGH